MKRLTSLVAWLFVGVVFGVQVVTPVRAQGSSPGGVPVIPHQPQANSDIYLPVVFKGQPPDSIFGIEMGYELSISTLNGPSDMMKKAGAALVRHNALLWSKVEPTPGARQWDTSLDQKLLNARENNLNPILIIRSAPLWAQKFANNYCGPVLWSAMDEFANFMRDVVTRYSGFPYYITYYELWNEPDISYGAFTNAGDTEFGCWGDPADNNFGGWAYADLLKWAYPAIKQANPRAQVLIGGLLLDCDPNNPPPNKDCKSGRFLQGILANGGGPYFDGVSYHAYDYFNPPADLNDPKSGLGTYSNSNWFSSWNTTGPVLFAKTNFVRNVLNQYGIVGKYLINSEVGLLCGGDYVDPHCDPTFIPQSISFQNTKAYYVVQSYSAARYVGLKANIWYSYLGWRDSGLFQPQTNTVAPAYYAYSFTRQQINWSYSANTISPALSVKGYEFNKTGKKVWVLWYVGGDPNNGSLATTVQLPSMPVAIWRWMDVDTDSGTTNDGTYQPASISQSISVGRAPVFVEFTP